MKQEIIERLREAGFIHITGLPLQFGHENQMNGKPVSASSRERGKWGSNNGMVCAILETGEAWLASNHACISSVARSVCPRGEGAWVPCSNGEGLSWYHLVCRAAFSNWHGDGDKFDFHPDPEQAEFAYESWREKYHSAELERAREAGALAERERLNPPNVKVRLTAVGQ